MVFRQFGAGEAEIAQVVVDDFPLLGGLASRIPAGAVARRGVVIARSGRVRCRSALTSGSMAL